MSIFPTAILLAVDASEEAALAANTAVDIAQKTNSGLYVVHVKNTVDTFDDYFIGSLLDKEELQRLDVEAQQVLDTQVKRIAATGGVVAQAYLRAGRPDKVIVDLGEELSAGLIVLGSRGLGSVRRALLGSVSESVVRHAHCPVFVVRRERALERQPVT